MSERSRTVAAAAEVVEADAAAALCPDASAPCPDASAPCLDVAAYLDGELDEGTGMRFERHAKTCASCATALGEQRRLLCVLDAAFGDAQKQLQLPANFTEVVRARAQSDMSSVRHRSERKRAALLSAGLAALSFALLGWQQAWDELFAPVRAAAGVAETLCDMAANAVGEAAAGVALMLRVLGGQMFEEPRAASSVGTYIVFAIAVALLFRLVINYHRTPRLPD